jgi:NUMOD4 motif
MIRTIESWKPATEIADGQRFVVSSRGRVRDLATGKIQKLTRTKAGFLVVRARYDNRRQSVTLHRLVAMTFLPGKPTYPVIFKDGNRKRCMVSNLRWSTPVDKRTPYRKLTDSDIEFIRNHWKIMTGAELAEEMGVCRQTISEVLTGKRWVGPQWPPAPKQKSLRAYTRSRPRTYVPRDTFRNYTQNDEVQSDQSKGDVA